MWYLGDDEVSALFEVRCEFVDEGIGWYVLHRHSTEVIDSLQLFLLTFRLDIVTRLSILVHL